MIPPMRLIRPTASLREAFLEMAHEMRAAGDDKYAAAIDDFDAFLERLRDAEDPAKVSPHLVPGSTFWLVEAGRVLARSGVRHGLMPHLEVEGGHIGYDVRPSARGQGVGTRLLALTLVEARRLGLLRVLLTCDDDNIASARVIEKNGGEAIESTVSPDSGKRVRRYWIRTQVDTDKA